MEGTLYLVPVGRVEDAIVNHLCRGLEAAFGTPSVVAPALPQPSYAYSLKRDQYLATSILEQLTHVDLQNAFRILGVVDSDLYVPQLNFVFGQARLGGRAALYRPATPATGVLRTAAGRGPVPGACYQGSDPRVGPYTGPGSLFSLGARHVLHQFVVGC
jgi:hypothetical protein